MGHSILAPSGADTWMACPASAAMQKGLPDSSSEYSDEGTAAHLLLSTCLEQGKRPADFLGLTINVGVRAATDFDGAVWSSSCSPEDQLDSVRRAYNVDDDMAFHIEGVMRRLDQYSKGAQMVQAEHRTFVGDYTTEPEGRGTCDVAVVLGHELQIHDLKYGMGVQVYAKENRQLRIYALGVLASLDPLFYGPITRVRIVIHQPRLNHLDEWDCTVEELLAFGEEVKASGAKAWRIYQTGEAHAEDFAPSEDACRWCKARAYCTALHTKVTDECGLDFTAEEPPKSATLPSTTPEAIGRMLKFVPLMELLGKALREEGERLIFSGVKVPGWKIVEGKRGSRAWSDKEKAEQLLKAMRLKVEDRCNLTIKTPPQLEKVLRDTPKRWQRVQDSGLIVQAEGKPSMAREDDPRKEWTPPDASADFTATTEEVTA